MGKGREGKDKGRVESPLLWIRYAPARTDPAKRTKMMTIANGTYVSFCNQPKAHFGLPWVRPWDNRGKCHMDSMLVKQFDDRLSRFDTIPACDPLQKSTIVNYRKKL